MKSIANLPQLSERISSLNDSVGRIERKLDELIETHYQQKTNLALHDKDIKTNTIDIVNVFKKLRHLERWKIWLSATMGVFILVEAGRSGWGMIVHILSKGP